MKKLAELFKPKAAGERAFMDKHVVQSHPDPYGNGTDVRNASNLKTFSRASHHMGYDPGEDVKKAKEWAGDKAPEDKEVVIAHSVGNWQQNATEEVELDELSKGKLRDYKSKASADLKNNTHDKARFGKRLKGIGKAQVKLNKFESVELEEIVTSMNKTNGFHGTIAGTNEEKGKLFHSFHTRVKTLTGAEDIKMVRDFLDSAHGRKMAEMINTNQPKDELHSHVLARFKAFQGTYSPDHFKEELLPEGYGSFGPTFAAMDAHKQPKRDKAAEHRSNRDRMRSQMSFHSQKALDHGNEADENERSTVHHRSTGNPALSDHHANLAKSLRAVQKGHDRIAAHYGVKLRNAY